MTCREFADFLDAYVAGELATEIVRPFERHITVCPNCRRYLDHYRAAIALGRGALDTTAGEVPADVPEDLIAAILGARSSTPSPDM